MSRAGFASPTQVTAVVINLANQFLFKRTVLEAFKYSKRVQVSLVRSLNGCSTKEVYYCCCFFSLILSLFFLFSFNSFCDFQLRDGSNYFFSSHPSLFYFDFFFHGGFEARRLNECYICTAKEKQKKIVIWKDLEPAQMKSPQPMPHFCMFKNLVFTRAVHTQPLLQQRASGQSPTGLPMASQSGKGFKSLQDPGTRLWSLRMCSL